jgi:hypothetical protein
MHELAAGHQGSATLERYQEWAELWLRKRGSGCGYLGFFE